MTSPSSQGPPPATGTTQTELRGPDDWEGEAPHAAVSNKHIVSAGSAVRVQQVTMSQQRVNWLQWSSGRGCPVVRALRLSLGPEGTEGVSRRGGGWKVMVIWRTLHPSSFHPAPYCPLKESQRCGGVNDKPEREQTHRQGPPFMFFSFSFFFLF